MERKCTFWINQSSFEFWECF